MTNKINKLLLITISILYSCKTNDINRNVTIADVQQELTNAEQQLQEESTQTTTLEEIEQQKPQDLSEITTNVTNPRKYVNDQREEATINPNDITTQKTHINYLYEPNLLYTVYTAKNFITDITLEPGEQLTDDIVIGKLQDFIIRKGISYDKGKEVIHIYITPINEGIVTNMIITTNLRTYYLKIETFNFYYMVVVKWQYPKSATNSLFTTKEQESKYPTNVRLDYINFDYKIKVKGKIKKSPKYIPTTIFDDGTRTYIKIDEVTQFEKKPTLYKVVSNKNYILNYRIKGLYFIVDGTHENIYFSYTDRNKDLIIIMPKETR